MSFQMRTSSYMLLKVIFIINNQASTNFIIMSDQPEHADLVGMQPTPAPKQQAIIDPYEQIKAGNPFPLMASIPHIDLTHMVDQNTPLLHLLCKLYLPLDQLLQGKQILFTKNPQGKTPLHFAIESGDIQAVYWCLRHSPYINPRDNTGLTPAMLAVKSRFRLGFMLCVHYGHVDEELAHVAAFSNDVWALRFLRALKVDLYQRNPGGITALGVGAHHLSYQAVYYLAKLNPKAIDYAEITKASQSVVMLKKLTQIKMQSQYGAQSLQQKLFTPTFPKQSLLLLTLFFLINSLPGLPYTPTLFYPFLLQLLTLIYMYFPVNHGPKRAINIQQLLRPPTFPDHLQICPDCIQIKEESESYEHCEECGVCVRGFHFHQKGGKCVYYGNQGRWAVKEVLWWWIFNAIVNCYLGVYPETMYTSTHLRGFQTLYILHYNCPIWLLGVPLYLTCWFWLIKKSLLLISIFYMIFTSYTYQEMMNNHRYAYLYKPIKRGEHYQNKRIYLFDEGVRKGIGRAISNFVGFFFGR